MGPGGCVCVCVLGKRFSLFFLCVCVCVCLNAFIGTSYIYVGRNVIS